MTAASTNHIDHISPDISAIKRDIASLRRDIAGATSTMTSDIAEQFTSRGGRAAKAISHQIEEQPLISLAIAFAVGFIGSKILLR